jgi:hypothetical protein
LIRAITVRHGKAEKITKDSLREFASTLWRSGTGPGIYQAFSSNKGKAFHERQGV